MDASSFAIPMATMDKMTFLVDKLPEGVTSVELTCGVITTKPLTWRAKQPNFALP